MAEEQDLFKVRKDAVLAWIKKPDNATFIAILVLAIVIRLYYFKLTLNQPLWWDEAEYMLKAKSIALGTPSTGWAGGIRPILFPVLSSIFFKAGLGESSIKFFIVLLSLGGITLSYFIGKEMYDPKVGLITALLMSVFYIDAFYSTRLLVDVPQIFFINLALFLFVKNKFGEGSNKLIWAILPIIALGTQFRFTVGLVGVIFFLFLISTQGFQIFRVRDWYISAGLALALSMPYLLYTWAKFGNPLHVILGGLTSANSARGQGVSPLNIFMSYITYLPKYSNLIYFSLFLIGGLLVLINLFLTIDKIRSNKNSQKNLLLVLLIIIPFIYFGFFVNHFEDRYIFMAFPAIFVVTGFGVAKIYGYLKRYSKPLAIIIILIIMIYGAWASVSHIDGLIKSKVNSYSDFKEAGAWIMQNSNPHDAVISSGMPQLTYYSERPVYPYPVNESDLLSFKEEVNASFMILTQLERTPDWTYNWPSENQDHLEIVQAYFADSQKSQPTTIIYKFK